MTPNNTKLVERLTRTARVIARMGKTPLDITTRDVLVNPDGPEAAALIAELVEALTGMLPIVFTGSPTSAQNIAHWESERELGNDNAPSVLAAYAALERARA